MSCVYVWRGGRGTDLCAEINNFALVVGNLFMILCKYLEFSGGNALGMTTDKCMHLDTSVKFSLLCFHYFSNHPSGEFV